VKFEEKIKENTTNKILKECLIEIEKDKQNNTKWKTEKEMSIETVQDREK